MAVHISLARCLRATPSSILLRPMVSQPSSSSYGQLHLVYQRSGYASNVSPNTNKATKHESPSSEQAPPTTETSSKPSILNALNLENSTTVQATGEGGGDDGYVLTEQEIRLKNQMAELDSQMKDLSRPSQYAPSQREFFALPRRNKTPKAEVDAEKTLQKLLSKSGSLEKASQQQQQQQQQQQSGQNASAIRSSSSSAAINSVDEISPPKLRPIAMKLDTKLGRQVLVHNERGMDCASAIRTVQINCSTNGVRRQYYAQRFHVRRGQKRKDLKSARWKKLFKFSFDATVKKIQRMRDQGW